MNTPEPQAHTARPVTWRQWLQQHDLEALFEIQPDVAHLFDGIMWQPTEADQRAAWQLYTELRTRITTQILAYRSGDEAAALDSVYRLFEFTREAIKEHHGCTHFAALTIHVLNTRVRPFTAKWHRVKVEDRLSNADVRFAFRRELTQRQPALRMLTHLLGLLAGDKPVIAEKARDPVVPPSHEVAGLWDALSFGISPDTSGKTYANAINEREKQEILERRKFYGLQSTDAANAVGLAISGGGIRSATFALGVVQLLARKGVLREVDYLSTVSGGGYLGSFITSFLNTDDKRVSLSPDTGALPFGGNDDPESQGVRNLRNHSKYLTEGGFKTLATVGALVAYGMVVSLLLLSPLILAAVLIAVVFFGASFGTPAPFTLGSTTKYSLFALGASVLLLPVIQNIGRNRRLRSWSEGICITLAILCVALIVADAAPVAFNAVRDGPGTLMGLVFAAVFPVLIGALVLWLGPGTRGGRIVFSLFAITGPLLVIAAFFWLLDHSLSLSAQPDFLWWFGGLTLAAFLYTTFVLNINFASPHRYYRDRLARTYMTRLADPSGIVQSCDPQLLSAAGAAKKAPYHLINAALNIPACKDPNLRGRDTDFFLFSKHFCGSPILGFWPTGDWEAMDRHLDLGTAMAISGAAAAPRMGTMTSSRYTFLLAILNVRLGYWARRPGTDALPKMLQSVLPPPGWLYFFKELTGLMTEKSRYVNLSDGGHIENLGIYELLRRRCKFVIAIDGEADPKRSFGGLLTLTQMAKIDLGVRIEPDVGDLRTDPAGRGRAHFGLSRIEYPDKTYGLLLYVKSSLTGNEPEFLKKYHSDNPDFPHQSTAQQLFSETQFEAYRSLGEHVAEDLFREDLVGQWQVTTGVDEWFRRLASHLL